ncbi:MFS transporter [Hydrogenophaga sp.]|uniref:MFS transporter n=1 Tax=Hydrogenophaga sp. TaxID=1904254 RepID=UPI0025C14C42|nr:MFS transporter [Hydrogenophaga sp.]
MNDSAMGPLLVRLSTLLSGVALLVVGVGLLFSVLGLRAGLADFSSITLGLVTSAYFVGFVLGTYLCPVMIRRVGHIRAFAAMASLASTMPILHALWIDPWFWGALRLVTGVCMVGLYIVLESWLNSLAPNALRGRLFAVYMAINFVGLAVGQWLILVGDRLGFVPFAMVSVMFSFALLPITMTPVDEPEPVEAPRLSLRSIYEASPVGMGAALSSGLITGAFYGMAALFAQGVGFSDAQVASFVAAAILGGAFFQWPVGHYSDTHDRRLVLMWVCIFGAGVCSLGYLLAGVSPDSLIPLAVLFGGLIFAIYGLCVAHVNDVIDSSRLVEFSGGLLLIHGIGAAIGPVAAGVVMDVAGSSSLMLYFAAVMAGLALYALKRLRYFTPVPAEEKSTFVAMGGGSQAVLQMDPRSLADDTSPPAHGAHAPDAPR